METNSADRSQSDSETLPKLKELTLDEINEGKETIPPDRAKPASRLMSTDKSALTDRDVLIAFYHATNGRDWHHRTNWLSDGPLDKWHGVATDGDGRVTSMSLNVNWLSGSLPSELGSLPRLERLHLSRNHLSGPIPPELGNLSKLRMLYLSNNQLTDSIPPELANLANLEELDLSLNAFSGPIPSEFRDFADLHDFDLDEFFMKTGQSRQSGLFWLLLLVLGFTTLIGLVSGWGN